MTTRFFSVLLASALFMIGSAAHGAAEEWPSRPVRLVSPFAPGGTADILARILADHLSNGFKQQFFVESRPGASGAIGLQSVANSAPDGYNFLLGTVSILTLLPIINPKIGYDATRDLTNIAPLEADYQKCRLGAEIESSRLLRACA